MRNLEEEIKDTFFEKLKEFEEYNEIVFDDSAKDKLLSNYINTLIIEKDIEPDYWLIENKDDILYVYKEELHEKIDN